MILQQGNKSVNESLTKFTVTRT